MRNIVIIGGGASGMMAAISASFHKKSDDKIILLEKNEKPGKKLMVTGNGKCNFTNTDQDISHYHTLGDTDFIKEALDCFGEQETVALFLKLGIYSHNRNGYLYPYSNIAKDVTDALEAECRDLGVKMVYHVEVSDIIPPNKDSTCYRVKTEGYCYEADRVILSCGSMAGVPDGTGESGYKMLASLGHTILKPLPALVSLHSNDMHLSKLARLRTAARARLLVDGRCISEDTGEIQFNANNISGIPIFQISQAAARCIEQGISCQVELGFLPEFNKETLEAFIKYRMSALCKRSITAMFCGLLPGRLAQVLCEKSGINTNKLCSECGEDDIINLCKQMQHMVFTITKTNDFKQAQCCSGGVSTDEINATTMESKLLSGLYITGELMDVNGDCGGYNLQWAWTSGYIAGRGACSL